jgi:hypothetical protein
LSRLEPRDRAAETVPGPSRSDRVGRSSAPDQVAAAARTAVARGITTTFGRRARDIGLDPDLGAGHAVAPGILDPILAGEVLSATWDAARRRWKP